MISNSSSCNGCNKCYHGIQGAGCLIFDSESKEVILLYDDWRKSFNDAGGNYDPEIHKDLQQCAEQELCEETRGLLDTNLNGYKCIDLDIPLDLDPLGHKYRMYVLYVNGLMEPTISCKEFDRTDVSKLSEYYQETSRMVRFPIRQFNDELLENPNDQLNPEKKGRDGEIEKLNKRALSGIASAIRLGYL